MQIIWQKNTIVYNTVCKLQILQWHATAGMLVSCSLCQQLFYIWKKSKTLRSSQWPVNAHQMHRQAMAQHSRDLHFNQNWANPDISQGLAGPALDKHLCGVFPRKLSLGLRGASVNN